MKHRRSFLPYLLILIGIILPIFLMQHLMQTTAHKGGVAKKDIPEQCSHIDRIRAGYERAG